MKFLIVMCLWVSGQVGATSLNGVWNGAGTLVTINEPSAPPGKTSFPCQSVQTNIAQTSTRLTLNRIFYSCTFADGDMNAESRSPAWTISGKNIFYNGQKIGVITANKITIDTTDDAATTRTILTFEMVGQGMIFRERELRLSDGETIWDLKSRLKRSN